jgi:hypothetical protein
LTHVRALLNNALLLANEWDIRVSGKKGCTPMLAPFAIFVEDEKGPLFREYCADLTEAKRRTEELAELEGFPFIIFSFQQGRQVARVEPKPRPALLYCAERALLERLADEAEAILEAARNAFRNRSDPCLTEEFCALTEESRTAWQSFKRKKEALDAHIREHHCMKAT